MHQCGECTEVPAHVLHITGAVIPEDDSSHLRRHLRLCVPPFGKALSTTAVGELLIGFMRYTIETG